MHIYEFGVRRYIHRGLNISSCVARIPFDVDVAYYYAVNKSYIHIWAATYCSAELWKRSGPLPSKSCNVPDQDCDVKHDLQVKSQRLNYKANDSGFIIPNSRHNRPPFHRSFSPRKQKEKHQGYAYNAARRTPGRE